MMPFFPRYTPFIVLLAMPAMVGTGVCLWNWQWHRFVNAIGAGLLWGGLSFIISCPIAGFVGEMLLSYKNRW